MATLPALDGHGLPSDNNVFRNAKDTARKQRPQASLQPKTKVGPASRIPQLLDAVRDFRQGDVGDEQRLAWLSRDEIDDPGIGPGLAQFGNDVGVEQPTSHSLIFRTLDLIVRRSNFSSASGDAARAVTISRPVTGC